jgi:hypothetical protein
MTPKRSIPRRATGIHGRADWRDMSSFLVHFTKGNAYRNMMSILSGGRLRAGGSFGAARKMKEVEDSQRAVCFSEVPLGLVNRIAERRSLYGIAFRKKFIVNQGALPVWYLEHLSSAQAALDELQARARANGAFDDPVWKITPFVDYQISKPFQNYRFDWEREWRLLGDLKFSKKDVAFLFLDETNHKRARAFFEDAELTNVGPNYDVPYLDARWDVARIEKELKTWKPSGIGWP